MVQLWAGIDAGKTHHHCVVIDADGTRLYSQRVVNDESVLLDLIADVVGLAQSKGGGEVVWATDLNHGGAALLIALVIADQARMRRDLQPLYFPALEQAFDYSRSKASLLLLTRYRTPEALRRSGESGVQAWLKKQGARSSTLVAEKAVTAAKSQYTVVPAQRVGEAMVASLAQDVLELERELAELDALISTRVLDHRHTILLSMPGFGPILSAEFLGTTGGDMTAFDSADRLAGVAGLAPVPRDSGRISGNNHRPHRYDRRLLRVFYLAAMSSLKSNHRPGRTTTENAPKANLTHRPSSAWHAVVSTSSGPCFAMGHHMRPRSHRSNGTYWQPEESKDCLRLQ